MPVNYSKLGKIGAEARWKRRHSDITISKHLSKEKVALNGYLCGDGAVTLRPKGFHYEIRFFIDDWPLSKRIVQIFEKEFNVTPKIRKMKSKVKDGPGYFRIELKNKPVCMHLLEIGKYGHLTWTIPEMNDLELKKEWIRAYFDCEAYVNIKKKQIQVKSVNTLGLEQVKMMLEEIGIFPKLYGPYAQKEARHNPYSFLIVLGKDNLTKFSKEIGFYHSRKIVSLAQMISM